MPQVIHSYRGANRSPRLKLFKGERTVLANAAMLLEATKAAVAGHQPAMADKLGDVANELAELAKCEEFDLSKPPF